MSNVFIRSQNRESLYCFGISFNSLQYSAIREYKRKDEAKRHTICIGDGCIEPIAEYESKERCLEVLDELQEVCGKYLMVQGGTALIRGGMNVQPGAFEIPRVYEMPEK